MAAAPVVTQWVVTATSAVATSAAHAATTATLAASATLPARAAGAAAAAVVTLTATTIAQPAAALRYGQPATITITPADVLIRNTQKLLLSRQPSAQPLRCRQYSRDQSQ